ncbi:hypothetical protein GCM10009742_33460 [Kribbella karoonensis]|uniref:Uncharacterized protein n=1 Tax=Kribbella karoonensis TaxID=324851 RepID=A0ABN2DUQ5_9ACTN
MLDPNNPWLWGLLYLLAGGGAAFVVLPRTLIRRSPAELDELRGRPLLLLAGLWALFVVSWPVQVARCLLVLRQQARKP